MYSTAYVWAKVLGHMEARLTPQVVSTWFDDTEILELTDQKLVLYSPSTFRKDIILRRCTGYIKEAMQEIFQMNVEVEVLDETEIEAYRGRSQKPEFIEFNPQFTFDNFVVGSSNRFAHAAAVSVANNPAETYNPLFIYGPSGLGKTHLLYAIASVVHKKSSQLQHRLYQGRPVHQRAHRRPAGGPQQRIPQQIPQRGPLPRR